MCSLQLHGNTYTGELKMIKVKNIFSLILAGAMIFTGVSCSSSGDIISEVTDSEADADVIQEELHGADDVQLSDEPEEYIDNVWASFLVSPAQPGYTDARRGYEILDVLCKDPVIGEIASMSREAEAPEDTVAYDEKVITAGGPVSTANLAYGKLTEVPQSFLNAMVSDMKKEIGEEYGEHSGGSGMGYRTFYQASYDAEYGDLQVNQTGGYWARTLGAYSEHCAGVAVDFDISYNNSEYLESAGRFNRGSKTPANTEFTWLADNAHRYGFIWRYKIGGASDTFYGMKTGTIMEGWHWRFVGVYNATKFWEKCAEDSDGDGVPDKGYMKNDNYVWEDYYVENIAQSTDFPHDEHEALVKFYNSPEGNKCTYEEYISRK